MAPEQISNIKVCPKCGASFTCTPTNCWCSELPPVMPLDLNAECYCLQCLKAIIDEKIKSDKIIRR